MFKKYFILFMFGLMATNSFATDIKQGEELFNEAKCMECHNEIDFTQKTKKANNFNSLNQYVQACQIRDDIGWFDDESLDVSHYLNQKYYKFKTK